MKKKLIGLSTLLLVLLLGLSSICYADVNHVWTENQLKNVIYNYLHTSYSDSYIESYFNYHASEITNVVNKMNSNNYVYIIFQQTGPSNFFVGYGNTDSVWYRSVSNGKLYMANSSGYNYWIFPPGNSAGWENSGYYNLDRFNINYYYFSKPVYNNANAGSLFFAGGMYPETYWTGPYLDDHFDFTYDSNISFASLHDSQGYFGEVALVPKGTTSIKLGELEQAQFIDYIIKQKMKYNKYTGFFDTYSAETITTWTDSNDVYNVFVNGNDIANIFVLYTAYSNNSDFLPLNYSYFITDNMTIISGDTLELALTFDDDNYYNNYNNTIQNEQDEQAAQDRTDEIINTITDDSQVTGILNDFGSGDINTFASKFGLPSIPNPFSNFIETIFYGITDVLTLDGDVTLNFGILGTLNSNQFKTPTNAVTIFVASFMTFIFVYYMIELGYSTLMSIREFNLDKSGIYHVEGMHPESGLQADGSWRLL